MALLSMLSGGRTCVDMEDFCAVREPDPRKFLWHQKVGKGHGRVERRTAAVCHDVDWLLERHDWPGLQAIGKITGEREFPDGSGSADTRCFLLGAKLPAARFAHVAHSHRAIENAAAARPTPPLGSRRDHGR